MAEFSTATKELKTFGINFQQTDWTKGIITGRGIEATYHGAFYYPKDAPKDYISKANFTIDIKKKSFFFTCGAIEKILNIYFSDVERQK